MEAVEFLVATVVRLDQTSVSAAADCGPAKRVGYIPAKEGNDRQATHYGTWS